MGSPITPTAYWCTSLCALCDSDATRALWDNAFKLELDVLVGKELSLVLTTRNTGTQPLTYSGALHTYLTISQHEAVSVSGLGEPYADKLTGQDAKQQGGIDPEWTAGSGLLAARSAGERETCVVSGNHDSVVVLTPWLEGATAITDMSDDGYRTMLRVEAAIAGEAGVTVAPDEERSLPTVII